MARYSISGSVYSYEGVYWVYSNGVHYYMDGDLLHFYYNVSDGGDGVLDSMVFGSTSGRPVGGAGGSSSSGSSGSPAGNGPGGPSSGAAPGAPGGFSGAGPGGMSRGTSIFQGQGSTPAERFWNSPMMRLTIPDKISFGIAGEWAYFVGIDVNTFNFTVLTRGEAGIYYTPNINVRAGVGSYVSGGVNFSTGLFTGNPSNITASMLQGSTYGVMATGAYIGKASLGASYSPSEENIRQGFINMDIGVGLGAGPAGGAGGFFGAQYQYTPAYGTIWKWY